VEQRFVTLESGGINRDGTRGQKLCCLKS